MRYSRPLPQHPYGGWLAVPASYSPDFNPLEQVSAKLKARLRAVVLRTGAGLWAAVDPALAAFSPTECANYIRQAGYHFAPSARELLWPTALVLGI